jgi:hypothetical protein
MLNPLQHPSQEKKNNLKRLATEKAPEKSGAFLLIVFEFQTLLSFMRAQLHVKLPFKFDVPEGEQFSVPEITHGEYKVYFYPPLASEAPIEGSEEIIVNGARTFAADILKIEFQKDVFDRRQDEPMDPRPDFIETVINSFLNRLRFCSNFHHIKPITFPQGLDWRLEYLTDNGEQLDVEKGLCRGRVGKRFSLSFSALTSEVWNSAILLPDNFEIPLWSSLLLDARSGLPEIGPSIVLANTALEVFIASVLDELASKSTLSPDFWSWLNSDNNGPSTADQFDSILKQFTQRSLKDEPDLWKAFEELKSARNNFVHEGKTLFKAGSGKKKITLPLNRNKAEELLFKASEIIGFVRSVLPDELKWPEFSHTVSLEARMRIA